MEFKSRFEVGDIVYFYDNDKNRLWNHRNGYLEPHGMFILQGEIKRIIVDYMAGNDKLKQPFITYKVRIGVNIIEDVHEDFMALCIDELAEQSKHYHLSKVDCEANNKKQKKKR